MTLVVKYTIFLVFRLVLVSAGYPYWIYQHLVISQCILAIILLITMGKFIISWRSVENWKTVAIHFNHPVILK